MKWLRTFFILSVNILFLCHPDLFAKVYEDYDVMVNEFKGLDFDPDEIYEVKDLMIIRDIGTIYIESGRINFCRPLNGRVCAAGIEGEIKFELTPTRHYDQEQLNRNYKMKQLSTKLDYLFIFFRDDIYKSVKETSSKIKYKQTDVIKESKVMFLRYGLNETKYAVDPGISRVLLNDQTNDYLYALMKTEHNDELVFIYDAMDDEEVGLYQTSYDVKNHDVLKSMLRCPRVELASNGLQEIMKPEIDMKKVKIDLTLDKKFNIVSDAKLDARISCDSLKWLWLGIFNDCRINGITNGAGDSLKFHKIYRYSNIWVNLGRYYRKDDSIHLNIAYTGDLIADAGLTSFLKTNYWWYPNYRIYDKALYDMCFTVPNSYLFACSGEMQEQKPLDNGFVFYRFTTRDEITRPFFVMDTYTEKKSRVENGFALNLYYKNPLFADLIKSESDSSYFYYSNFFGGLGRKRITVVELPYTESNLSPGLVQLHEYWFKHKEDPNSKEKYAATAMAQQWWGCEVAFDRYQDSWLETGLANYSAMLFLQRCRHDYSRFFTNMDYYRTSLIKTYEEYSKDWTELGPMIFSGRNYNNVMDRFEYGMIEFQKSTWVIHMLRMMLIDLNSLNDDVFDDLLKDFYKTYRNKNATTMDFKRLLEEKTKFDFGWFFEEWVEQSKIPYYKVSYKTEKSPEGKYKVTVRVKQEKVPGSFKMFVPLKIVFKDKKISRFQSFITGEQAEFELPLLPGEPDELVFNDLQSVLCDVEYVKWR